MKEKWMDYEQESVMNDKRVCYDRKEVALLVRERMRGGGML